MKLHGVRNERGTVIVFTIIVLVFLLVMGGIAVDLAYHAAAKGEFQRSMDAAALAGAGKLGFDDTVFPEARQFAQQYGALNPYRVGTVDLDLNPTNDPGGDIVLGIWQGVEDPEACLPAPNDSSCSATACFTPMTCAIRVSNSDSFGPRLRYLELSTARTAFRSNSVISGPERGISSNESGISSEGAFILGV